MRVLRALRTRSVLNKDPGEKFHGIAGNSGRRHWVQPAPIVAPKALKHPQHDESVTCDGSL